MDGWMDGGTWYHPKACATLGLKHTLHSFMFMMHNAVKSQLN